MIVFHHPSDVPSDFGPAVVAIGKFDGVHSGHKAVLDRARVDAATGGARVVAITFDRNPLALLRPELCPPDLIGVHQKVRLLAETGIDAALVLRFDQQLADLTPLEFVQRVLVDSLHVRTVLIGRDFRFGRGGAGDSNLLRELGVDLSFDVDVVDDVRAIDGGRRVSSTWVRELLKEGDVESAAKLLGRPASVRGQTHKESARSRGVGLPAARLVGRLEGFVPPNGVYAGWLVDQGVAGGLRHGQRYPAAITVGVGLSYLNGTSSRVEAYLLDETDIEVDGHDVEMQFVARIRRLGALDGDNSSSALTAEAIQRVRATLR